MRKKVAVKVPATVGNLGPGFDCLGLALDLYNTIQVTRNNEFRLIINGKGKETLFHSKENLVYKAISNFFDEINQPIPDLQISCYNEIPVARGLGSSAAAIIGGLVAANSLAGDVMTQEQLLQFGTNMEAHPDNLTPALFGGCQVVVHVNDKLVHRKIPLVKPWRFVLFIPDLELSTKESRNVLDFEIARVDAVYNLGRIALLIRSFITGDVEDLKIATEDRLHQPKREGLFPAMSDLFRVAMVSGADGVFLAGSGPTIVALASGNYDTIGKAMLMEGRNWGINGQVSVLRLSEDGTRIIEKL